MEKKCKMFMAIEITTLISLQLAFVVVYLVPYTQDSEATTNCYAFGCIMPSQIFYVNVRNIVAVLICATGMLLFYVFYKKSKHFNGQNTKYNKNVRLLNLVAFS